jgi:hypothetical protein
VELRQVMEGLGRVGVTVLLKFDHERAAEGTEPWTMLLSGPGVGGSFIRAESESLDSCVGEVLGRLRDRPGDWNWLPDFGSGQGDTTGR